MGSLHAPLKVHNEDYNFVRDNLHVNLLNAFLTFKIKETDCCTICYKNAVTCCAFRIF